MSDLPIADRVRRIRPSPNTVAAARAQALKAEGRDIVDLTIGEPDFDTPENIKAAAIRAIEAGQTKYTPVTGTPALRAAIRAKFRQRLGIEYNEAEITLGGGAKQVIFLALMATVDNGAEVIVPAPYWVSYPDMVAANEGVPIVVACAPENDFKLRPVELEAAITPRTRWLILNSPGNPTGATYHREELRGLADVLLRHPHVHVLADEIYDEIVFDNATAISLVTVEPALRDRILVVNGVSKTYAMTGWRIGYAAGERGLIAAINTLQSQMSSCPSSISQAAAVAALSGEQNGVEVMSAAYQRRRDLAIPLLNSIPGLSCKPSAGAFYLFVSCAGVIGRIRPDGERIGSDLDFCLYLLEREGVAVMHGGAYGLSPFLRLSIATSETTIREACVRIARAVEVLRDQ